MHTRLDTCTVVVMYMHKYMLTYVFVFASATWITFLTLWRLLESLARLEVPRRLFKLIKHMCTRPKFRVSCDEGKSDFFFQQSGIRQGCPPSAYLFILVMSVMFADIKSRLNTPKQREPIPAIHFSEIIFAGGTRIFGEHAASLRTNCWKKANWSQHTTTWIWITKNAPTEKFLLPNTKVERLCPEGSRRCI